MPQTEHRNVGHAMLKALLRTARGIAKRHSSKATRRSRILLLALMLWGLSPVELTAEDVVILSSGQDAKSQTRIVGEVLDYNGTELTIRLNTGAERTFPSDQVFEIQPARSEEHKLGDEALAGFDYTAALAAYQDARRGATRRWVRELIIANMVTCYQNLGQAERAGEMFLILIGDDENSPYFDCIPLAWAPQEPSPQLAQQSRSWLRRDDLPAAILLGASHLLSTNERPAALGRLKRLQLHEDSRIAMLAQAQSWRAAVATASQRDLQQWQQVIESAPQALRGGPYFVLGQALALQQEPTRAALALLRVPINHPQDRELAARCLFEAAGALQRRGQVQDAHQLYRELTEDYTDLSWATVAAQRIEALRKDQ